MFRLSFEPLISPVLWGTLAALAVALMTWYGWNRPRAVPRQRWAVIVTLMSLGLLAVLILLLNPLWVEPLPPPAGKPVLTYLVDVSQSMATADGAKNQSRFQQAAELVQRDYESLKSRFDVRIRTFSGSTSPISSPKELADVRPTGPVTDLGAGLAEVIEAGQPQGQAVVLFSDGIHHAPGGTRRLFETVRTTRAMSIPIYSIPVGGPGSLRDLEVGLVRPQELSFAGQVVPLSVVVKQRGKVTDKARLTLTHNGKVLERQEVPISADGTAAAQFRVSQKEQGLYRYEVKVDALPGEATEVNNSTAFLLRIVNEPIRVLLLEGKPYWDTKFLMRNFAADPVVEVDCLIRLKGDRFLKRSLNLKSRKTAEREQVTPPAPPAGVAPDAKAAAAPPATAATGKAKEPEGVARTEKSEFLGDALTWLNEPESLQSYQIIVLGRDSEVYLNDVLLQRIRDWIAREGGSLICYRGSPVAQVTQGLDRLLPVRWAPGRESHFRVQFTEFGSALRWVGDGANSESGEVLGKLPSLASSNKVVNPKPLAVVLARSSKGDGPPVVTYQPYASGRVVTIEGAGMWRWAFLSPDYRQNDDVYGSLWQSLLRWLVSSAGLVPGQEIALRSDRVLFTAGDAVTATLYLRKETATDKLPIVELFREGQAKPQEVRPQPLGDEPGVFQVPFGALAEGHYRARVAGVSGGGTAGTATADSASTSIAFDVQGPLAEQLDIAARPDLLKQIASESGGEMLTAEGSSGVADKFTEYSKRNRPEQVRRDTAWDRWWWLVAVLTLWGTAWSLRRSAGLI